jgi:hypothetical protein
MTVILLETLIMNYDITDSEKRILVKRFPDLKNIEGRGDIILAYDENFMEDIYEIANTLQDAVDFLKYVTDLNPANFFNSRILIGHNKNTSQAKWKGRDGNCIYVCWESKYFQKDEFLHTCSHELVHPFYRISPLHKSNEKWGEPFCEFLRGPCKHVMGQDGQTWWKKYISDHLEKGKDTYRNVTGQILMHVKSKYYDSDNIDVCIKEFINNRKKIKQFTLSLFEEFRSKSLCEILTPVPKMNI